MIDNVFKAILAMDSYNRGYNRGIDSLSEAVGTQIGSATIFDTKGDTEASDISFYAIAYDLGGGEKIISYRGTDDFGSWTDLWTDGDIWNGWFPGGGSTEAKQLEEAFEFYHSVIGGQANSYTADVTFTGHSLGGGLAGAVAATYDKQATVFDHMPYQEVLKNMKDQTDPLHPDYNDDLKTLLYGTGNQTDSKTGTHNGFFVPDEVLELVRGLVFDSINVTPINLGPGVDLPGAIPIIDEALALHSMSTLVILLSFLDQDFTPGSSLWDPAAKYFWPLLYKDDFADKIGFKNSILGELNTDGKYSDILRALIAYSAIDEGPVNTSARPFGDTGVFALHDDASNLGEALALSTASQSLVTYGEDISKVFVQFAGELAAAKILTINMIEAPSGVLGLSQVANSHTLTVDLSDALWDQLGTSAAHKLVAREHLFIPILDSAGGDKNTISLAMLTEWNDLFLNIFNAPTGFDQVVFALNDSGTTNVPVNPAVTPEVTLFVGGGGDDTINVDGGRYLIFGENGADHINVTATSQLGNNIYYGGNQVDTIDYTGTNFGVQYEKDASFGDKITAWDSGTGQTSGPTDRLISIENITGTNQDDDFKLSNFSNQVLDGAGGTNTLTWTGSSDFNNSVYDSNSNRYYDALGTRFNTFLNFDNLNASPEIFISDYSIDYQNFTSATIDPNPFNGFNYTGIENTKFDYSSAPGPLTIDVRFYEPGDFEADGVYDQPRIATVAGSGFNHELGQLDYLYGSNHGDTYYTHWFAHIDDFYLGKGDDVFFMEKASAGFLDIHYSGGNDTIHATDMLRDVFLNRSIILDDITASISPTVQGQNGGTTSAFTFTMDIANHGSLTIEYDDISGDTIDIILDSGGQITLSQAFIPGVGYQDYIFTTTGSSTVSTVHEGTWGADTWVGRVGYDETYYAKGGDDILTGNDGSDTIWGGDGIDQAIFSSVFADYIVTDYALNSTVEDTVGTDGTDTLYGVEQFVFSDGIYENGVFTPGNTTPPVAPTMNLALLLDPVSSVTTIADDPAINLLSTTKKTHSLAFETGSDVTTTQIVYEQGGTTRGLNFIVEGGKLYAAVWEKAHENWGFKELSVDVTGNTKYTATLVMDGALPADGTATLYLNGVQVGQISGVGQLYSHGDDTGVGQIAQWSSLHGTNTNVSDPFLGTVEKLAHYNAALSGTDLTDLNDYMAYQWLTGGPPPNQDPIAQDDNFTGDQDIAINGDLLADNGNGVDSDSDGGTLSVVAATSLATTQGGSVDILADGTFTYTPATGFTGVDDFTYTLEDGQGGSDVGTVTLAINAGGTPPTAPTTGLAILLDPVNGATSIADDPNINLLSTTTKTHSLSFETGSDVTTTQIVYEQGGTTRGLNFIVEGGKLYAAVWEKAHENWGFKEISADVTANTKYTATLVMDGALPANGTATLYLNGGQVGQVSGVGKLYSHGDDTGIGQIAQWSSLHGTNTNASNPFLGTVEKLAHYNVALTGAELTQLQDYMAYQWLSGGPPANLDPIAQDDSFTGDQDIVINGNVLSDNGNGVDSDPDGDPLNVVAVTGLATTQGGSVDLLTDGSFTYTPATGFTGADDFTYTLEDSQGGSDVGTVNLTLNAVGGGNDDTFIGTSAVETFDGGIGNDTVDYSGSGAKITIDLSNGTATGGDAAGDTLISIENLIGTDFYDTLTGNAAENTLTGGLGNDVLKGKTGDDTLYGGAGNDSLYGLLDNDTLHGGDDNDWLYGDNGDDILNGDAGDDRLLGDRGNDTMTGDTGADQFIYKVGKAFGWQDTITDFDTSENDLIDIADILTGYDPIADLIADFVQITDNGTDSFLAVDADGGADNFVQIATLQNVTGLTDEDALETSGNLVGV